MKFLLDTNIFVLLVKNEKFGRFIEQEYQNKFPESLYYSYITLGELDSIIKQNNWGGKRIKELSTILKGFQLLDVVSMEIIRNYGTVDAYSQGKLKNKPLPAGISARNMGKNDLWIAATALSIQATLITTDKDFDHLNSTFIQVDYVNVKEFQ
jgi:tRNA(fMet)-specific endonuclease VapC